VDLTTQHGSHIYTQVGCRHERYLLRPSHLLLVVNLVAEESNVWKTVTEKTNFYHTGKEEFVDRPTQIHQSTERIYNCTAPTRKKTCKYQITQYSYMRNFITHIFVGATVVSTSGRAWISWLLHVRFFMVPTSRNGKMRRNRCIRTTSVRIVIPIVWHDNNISYGKWEFISKNANTTSLDDKFWHDKELTN
jgi:hypothetical protein